MKKLKTWQLVLLIIFYPVGIAYFIYWLCKRKSTPQIDTHYQQPQYGIDTVFVNKGSKVYHADQMCAESRNCNSVEMHEKDAIKKGLHPCKRCYGNIE